MFLIQIDLNYLSPTSLEGWSGILFSTAAFISASCTVHGTVLDSKFLGLSLDLNQFLT